MSEQVLPPVRRAGPGGILGERLETQLLGDAQPFQRAEAGDAVAPVRILRVPNRLPVAADEFANAACDHPVIV